VVKRKNE
jgi:Ca2+-binding EF-hand superfamily protein